MKIKLSYLFLTLLFPVVFQSCSKDDTDSYAEWKQKNEQFINEIKNSPDYLQAIVPQGPGTIYYKIIKEGIKKEDGGINPIYTSQVKVHYKGSLIDDYVFDDSSERTYTTIVSSNVSGFAVALQNMTEGAKWKIYIPWELGYGSSGYSTTISPYSALIFEVELLQVSKY